MEAQNVTDIEWVDTNSNGNAQKWVKMGNHWAANQGVMIIRWA